MGSSDTREKTIIRASIISILANIMLSAVKAIIGFISGSIAVVLDAVNNLSDALSSVITIIGTALANRKPDKKHPLGHGRIEYLSAMIVAVIVLYAGITSGIESVKKLFHPSSPDYSATSLIIIALAVAVKILLGRFIVATGKRVDSAALAASGSDALFDAVLSASVLASALIFKFTGFNLEGFVGVLIAVFIIKAGIEMILDTTNEILGKRMDRDLMADIRKTICEDEHVSGAYDLILHSYGPDKLLGSVHVEVPGNLSAVDIDQMDRRIAENVFLKHGVVLTGIGVYATDPAHEDLRGKVTEIIRTHDGVLQIHGFHADPDAKSFGCDVIIDYDIPDRDAVYQAIVSDLQKEFPDWTISVLMDVDF